MTLNIAIAGGGIAGLTAALTLSKSGQAVTVFERTKTFEDIGAGIQLSPNAGKVLVALGLADAVKDVSFEPEKLQLVNGKNGRALCTLPFKSMMHRRYGARYLVTHRGDLQAVLLKAANSNPQIVIETRVEVKAIEHVPNGVWIGDRWFDILVVADGINSSLRVQIDPNAKVISDGQTAWRATLPLESAGSAQNAVSVYLNAGAHLVAYKMGVRPVLNLVYVSGNTARPSADDFGGQAKELINSATNWRAWPLSSVQSSTWHKGRAVMIGDAAHAMTPHAAQGGAMAIEDAMVLARCIQNNAAIEAAFEAFQATRQSRIAQVSDLSKQNRTIYQMGGVMALGRNAVMPLIPPSLLLKRLDWLYGWQA